MKKNRGFVLIEVVMAFFLISLLGTMIILVYTQTISRYDDVRALRKTYVLVNNIHEDFMANPEAFYRDSLSGQPTSQGGIMHFDEFLRSCGANERFVYRVFYHVDVNSDKTSAKLFISEVERKGKGIIKDLDLGKMRIA